jgi:hypothetical protein
MLRSILVSILVLVASADWHLDMILMDGPGGGTQAIYPYWLTNAGNLNYGLPHRPNSVAVLFQGQAYFIGGEYTKEVYIFNPMTNSSTIGASLNQGRFYHAATVANNTIIVCGSDVQTVTPFTCEQYSPTTQKWTFIHAPSTPTGYLAMTTLNDRAYVFGGYSTNAETADVFMYDGTNWIQRAPMPQPVHKHSAVTVDFSYTQVTTTMAPQTTPTGAPGAAPKEQPEYALICGGCLVDSMIQACYIYDPEFDTYLRVRDMAQPRWSHSAVYFPNSRIMTILGGIGQNGTQRISLDTIEVYSWLAGYLLPLQLPHSADSTATVGFAH